MLEWNNSFFTYPSERMVSHDARRFYSFIVLYQIRNISDAAVELNITQSALSKRLRGMQDELNTQLILRGTNAN